MQNLEEANRMLDLFASVGATHFDVTFLDIDGEKRGFRASQSLRQLKNSLPRLLPGLEERQNSLVVRPVSDTAALIQLDDLNAEALARLTDVALLTLATSPGNHQVWIAVRGPADKEFARRLRKGAGADPSASGATRLAGTLNYKRKYAPFFPTVTTIAATSGHLVAPEHIESLGLIAATEPVKAPPLRASTSRSWPDYERCVAGAPINNGNSGPDMSRADFMWCLMAAQRGHNIQEIAAKLMEYSSKAKENGGRYANVTAENAFAACEQARPRRR
jgi:hypothetical protein